MDFDLAPVGLGVLARFAVREDGARGRHEDAGYAVSGKAALARRDG
jgi:hypothetical protein